MSTHFSANQYDNAFRPKILRNWEVAKNHRSNPRTYNGNTQIIATDRGHLVEGVGRSAKNPWGDFVGTWDLPKQIPGQRCAVPTARSANAQDRLLTSAREAARVLNGTDKNVKRQAMKTSDLDKLPSMNERRSGAEAPASKMIPSNTPPEMACVIPDSQSVRGTPPLPCSVKSPGALPSTPPEVQKIPTPGLKECGCTRGSPIIGTPQLQQRQETPQNGTPIPPTNRTPTPRDIKDIEADLNVE